MIVDLFAGPGGWDLAAASLGLDVIGLEKDRDACATRRAVGFRTIRADVAEYPPEPFEGFDGLIASPPCQDFSAAGKRLALDTERGRLVYQPLRWARAIGPRWVACEQVPPARPIFEEIAHALEKEGYSANVAVLDAANYGVPQNRKRTILVARLDGVAAIPEPTHEEDPGGLFPLERWVTMAEALGLDDVEVNTGRDWKPGGARADAQTRSAGWRWLGFPRRDEDDPEKYRERDLRSIERPSPTITEKARSFQWWTERPATTVLGDSRLWPPGHRINQSDRDRLGDEEAERRYGDRRGSDAVRLTPEQALVLQSFPPDYPVAGSKTKKFQQIGNAVPPLLARAVLSTFF